MALVPAVVGPEGFTELIVGQQEDVAFRDAGGTEPRQARFDQGPADSFASARRSNREMMEIASSPIIAAENGADDSPFLPGDKAEPRMSRQIAGDAFAGVDVLVQPDPFRVPPKVRDLVIVVGRHGVNVD